MDLKSDIQRRLLALEVDASLHRPTEGTSGDESVEEEPEQDATASAVIAVYEEALRLLTKDVGELDKKVRDLSQGERQATVRGVVPELTATVSAHVGTHYWSSATSRQLARGVLEIVVTMCGCKSTLNLLVGQLGSHDSQTLSHDNHVTSPYVSMATRAEITTDSRSTHKSASNSSEDFSVEGEREGERVVIFSDGMIKPLLSLLRSKLTKETWKKQPSAKHALIWTLKHLRSYHKVLGLSAMSHLIRNMNPSELRWYGRAEVIYEAVKSMLYLREEAVINALHSCLVLLLPVMEGPHPITVTAPRKPTRTDEVFRILLNNLDYESRLSLRKAYAFHLSHYVDLLGIFTARHMKQVLKVISGCLEFPDYCGEETRQSALRALHTLLTYTWPRVHCHRDTILKMLLKLVSDLCPEDDYIPEKPEVKRQLKLVSECMLTLHHCCRNLQDVYRSLQRDSKHQGLLSCLKTSLANMEQGLS